METKYFNKYIAYEQYLDVDVGNVSSLQLPDIVLFLMSALTAVANRYYQHHFRLTKVELPSLDALLEHSLLRTFGF